MVQQSHAPIPTPKHHNTSIYTLTGALHMKAFHDDKLCVEIM